MAQLKDTEINGNLNVSGAIQIGDTDVTTAIDELNENITNRGIRSLIANVTASATETTFTTYNNRKISDYDFLIFQLKASLSDIRGSIIESVDGFSNGYKLRTTVTHDTNDSKISGVIFRYVSDTSIAIKLDNAAALTLVNVYGVKL